MYTVYGVPWYYAFPLVALVIVYISLVIGLIQHLRRSGVSWGGKKARTVLLVGPCNAGKTALFHALKDGRFVDTVTSMKEQEDEFIVHDEYNNRGLETKVNVIDYPGHERLRSRVSDYYSRINSIVFLVDGTDSSSFRSAAEYLYDMFADAKLNDRAPPMFIACNKTDQPSCLPPSKLKEQLEKELTQLKSTRSSLEVEGEDDSNLVPVGRDGQAFVFDVDCPCEVQFGPCSTKNAHCDDVVEFMQDRWM